MHPQYSFVCGYILYWIFYIESVKKGGEQYTLDEKIKNLLNEQINKEFESAYLYLGFANFFERLGLSGYAHYYEVQAREEIDHGLLIYKYLHHNNEKVKLMVVKTNTKEFKEIKDVLEYGVQAEESITRSINKIYELAIKIGDYRTMEFLSWFVKEQLEEEENAKKMISDYDLFTNNNSLFNLDNTYKKRDFVKANMEII